MVSGHALSHRRGSALGLEIDTNIINNNNRNTNATNNNGHITFNTANLVTNTMIRRASRRESGLPLSRHHVQMRRSSSVSTNNSSRSGRSGSLSSLNADGSINTNVADELALILDDDDGMDPSRQFYIKRRMMDLNEGTILKKEIALVCLSATEEDGEQQRRGRENA